MSGEPILSWESFIMIIRFQMLLILPKLIVRRDNAIELVEEFEREYCKEKEKEVRWQEAKEDKKVFSRELPERYTAKFLYRWGNKKYNWEYWKKMKKNWRK